MLNRRFCVACLLAVVVGFPAGAQEGHPLTGTWSGDWGPTATDRTHLTVVIEWEGTQITGTINPGPDAIPLTNVALDVTSWTVRLEAAASDTSKAAPITAQGRLDDIGSWHRTLSGTWTQGAVSGDFRLTRN